MIIKLHTLVKLFETKGKFFRVPDSHIACALRSAIGFTVLIDEASEYPETQMPLQDFFRFFLGLDSWSSKGLASGCIGISSMTCLVVA